MKRHSEEEKARLVEEWEKSGKSKRAFAKEWGLNVQTFTKWTGQGFVELTGKPEQSGGSVGRVLDRAAEAGIYRELAVGGER